MLRIAVIAAATTFACVTPAAAQAPIPEGPGAGSLPVFTGRPAEQRPVDAADPPRHPFMAPNGRSNLHVDAYQTDVHQGPGPLGRSMAKAETFLSADCASVTFDSRGRIVTVCVGLDGPRLYLMDAATLATLAVFPLPPRVPGGGNIFNDFAGGGYFYLDERDRAVIPTTTRHLLVVRQSADGARFELERDYDLTAAVPLGDKVVSALPDWSGRFWFVSQAGVVGTVDRVTGAVVALPLREPITNSFAVDETGGVYVVTDAALYRLDAGPGGVPAVTWRQVYANSGIAKPGQVGPGSGTTPTLLGQEWVAITDNDDPMKVVVYRRGDGGHVCSQFVFEKGASATDNSLIGAGRSLIVENNYGYTGPASTQDGRTTAPGLERIDIVGGGCRTVWRSQEIAPTVVPKLSAANGIVYAYTKDPRPDGQDAWYLTALDFRTGETLFKRLGGEGLGHNNNYAPVTLGPDGTAYVGVLGGLIGLRDGSPPPGAAGGPPAGAPARRRHGSLRLRVRRLEGGRVRARVVGRGVRQVRRVTFRARGRTVRVDRRRPFRATIARKRLKRKGRTKVVARIVRKDGTRAKRVKRVRRPR